MEIVKKIFFFLLTLSVAGAQQAEQIGHVNTVFRALGRDDQIVVEVFDDPKVQNVTCYVSRAVIGGITGELGIATDPSRMSIRCAQTGRISFLGKINEGPEGEVIFTQAQNWAFKRLNITRMVDRRRKVLIYLAWSTELIEGSYFNSISVVPLVQ
jgi:CreA protein